MGPFNNSIVKWGNTGDKALGNKGKEIQHLRIKHHGILNFIIKRLGEIL